MKIIQTIDSFNEKDGGVFACTHPLISEIINQGYDIKLVTIADRSGDGQIKNDRIVYLHDDRKTRFKFSRNMHDFLSAHDFDLYHTNGLWTYTNHITCRISRSKHKPYMISPHGMLYPEALKRNQSIKYLFDLLLFKKDINSAACLHATSDQEINNIRKYGYTGPIALIPNPISVPQYISDIPKRKFKLDDSIRIGFLGRLHPIKQVENIMHALSMTPKHIRQKVNLIIMGQGEIAYESFLHALSDKYQLNTTFTGFINGKNKYTLLSSLDALFVPSDMENFGMIIPEALLMNVPVMASLGTPWEILNKKECGWWADASPESIAKIIELIDVLDHDELKLMGARGHELVINNYTADKIAQQTIALYKWILTGDSTPGFIHI